MWEYWEPTNNHEFVLVRMSEGQILAYYWDWWSQMMRERGLSGINPDRCIQDWAVINWATKVG